MGLLLLLLFFLSLSLTSLRAFRENDDSSDVGPLHPPSSSSFPAFVPFTQLLHHFPSQISNKVLGNGVREVWRGHEDGDGAYDVENAERHQTQPVDDSARKFPLVGRALGLVLLPEAVGHVTHLLQERLKLRVSHPCRRAPSRTASKPPTTGNSAGTADRVQIGRGRRWRAAELRRQVGGWAPSRPRGPSRHVIPLDRLSEQRRVLQTLEAHVEQVPIVVGAGLDVEVGVGVCGV